MGARLQSTYSAPAFAGVGSHRRQGGLRPVRHGCVSSTGRSAWRFGGLALGSSRRELHGNARPGTTNGGDTYETPSSRR